MPTPHPCIFRPASSSMSAFIWVSFILRMYLTALLLGTCHHVAPIVYRYNILKSAKPSSGGERCQKMGKSLHCVHNEYVVCPLCIAQGHFDVLGPVGLPSLSSVRQAYHCACVSLCRIGLSVLSVLPLPPPLRYSKTFHANEQSAIIACVAPVPVIALNGALVSSCVILSESLIFSAIVMRRRLSIGGDVSCVHDGW